MSFFRTTPSQNAFFRPSLIWRAHLPLPLREEGTNPPLTKGQLVGTIWLLIISLLATSCVPTALASMTDAPVPPIGSSSLLGIPGHSEAAIAGLKALTQAQVQACVQNEQTVYGLTVENTNVRSAPDTKACRLGRIPQGKLVNVTGILTQTTTVVSSTNSSTGIGYAEDIQPIFTRNCTACHSSVVKQKNLQVTTYQALLKGSLNGPVLVPFDAAASVLWQQIDANKMPMVGKLSDRDKTLIKIWINSGAPERRPAVVATTNTVRTTAVGTWLEVTDADFDITTDSCIASKPKAQRLVSSELILPVACGQVPTRSVVAQWRTAILTPTIAASKPISGTRKPAASTVDPAAKPIDGGAAPLTAAPVVAAPIRAVGGTTAVSLPGALGLGIPSDSDGWLTPRGGFCIERHLPNNTRGITAMAFSGDGALYMGLDQDLTSSEADQIILYDAYHPSRSLGVYRPYGGDGINEILTESSRITGLYHSGGAIYLNRAGEVGRIPDGGSYEKLAGGFAVNSGYFHANNGIVVADGYIYISAGGIRDGYSDGPIVGVGEAGAQEIASGGNPWAARIVRAPLEALLANRNINLFETIGRGVRNPYGLARDPAGRLWFTDNGASNVPDAISAGDEVNVLSPGATGDGSPYYGFPLALSGSTPDWYAKPVVAMPNSAAPTGITWAYGTIFFATYGVSPGLYRLGSGAGGTVAERVLAGWPILGVATAPDGALWIGLGNGALYRLTPGC